jgi:hypothetical protein
MRFSLAAVVLAFASTGLAAPVAQRDNASSTTANNLANGINANLDAGNAELAGVQKSQSAIQNGGDVSGAEASVQGALTTAVGDREKNQAAAGGTGGSNPTAVQAGLDKVQTAQEGAQQGGCPYSLVSVGYTSILVTSHLLHITNRSGLMMITSGQLSEWHVCRQLHAEQPAGNV